MAENCDKSTDSADINQELELHDYWLTSMSIERDIGDEPNISPMLSEKVNVTIKFINDYRQKKTILFEQCRNVNVNFPCHDIRQWSVFDVKHSLDNNKFIFLFNAPGDPEAEDRLSFTCSKWKCSESPE